MMLKVIVLLCLFVPQIVVAKLEVADVFTDNAVLQQGLKVPVWGSANAGTNVVVTFGDQEKSTVAKQDGKWMIQLDPLKATYKQQKLRVVSGEEVITFNDVVIGEVWICSGQSNMQMQLNGVPSAKVLAEVVKNVRTFEVKQNVSFEESTSVSGKWKKMHPNSAVAIAFSHFLQQAGNVPVGIILTSWGSSAIEGWMPRSMVDTVPHFKTIMEEFDADEERQKEILNIISQKNGWSKKEDTILRRQMNIIYNAMIHPIIPYANRGLVWYQGERNAQSLEGMVKDPWFERHSGALKYGETLKEWIKTYRKLWHNDEMHFIVIMLPKFAKHYKTGPQKGLKHPASHSWAWMRESQLKALELPHTSVINTIDLGDPNNIHPVDKVPIGQRAAAAAAKATLGKDVVARGPTMKKVIQQGSKLVVSYEHATGLKTKDGESPSGFWISDDTNKWVKANAVLKEGAIELSAGRVKKPLYIRYAFVGLPEVNLVNGAGLPAEPFRTDTFQP